MGNTNFYTKGDYKEIITRIQQVHTITMYCPIEDTMMKSLKNTMDVMLCDYKKGDDFFECVPAIDALNAFVFTNSFNDSMQIEVDKGILSIIVSSLKMFSRLKKISFKFTDDEEILNSYKKLLSNKADMSTKYIYNVDLLEMNLSEMFSQSIIDFFNRVLIYNEIIPNSYLERAFVLDFKYDDYISFIGMFLANNNDTLSELDGKIENYFSAFPKLIMEQKPDIRVITNYSEL